MFTLKRSRSLVRVHIAASAALSAYSKGTHPNVRYKYTKSKLEAH
jgi:hypothetical protein